MSPSRLTLHGALTLETKKVPQCFQCC